MQGSRSRQRQSPPSQHRSTNRRRWRNPASPSETLAFGKGRLYRCRSTLHAYLRVIAAKRWNEADADWTGGRPLLDRTTRAFSPESRSMRIQNGSPRPLDQESPACSIEIPVTLRIGETTGVTGINAGTACAGKSVGRLGKSPRRSCNVRWIEAAFTPPGYGAVDHACGATAAPHDFRQFNQDKLS